MKALNFLYRISAVYINIFKLQRRIFCDFGKFNQSSSIGSEIIICPPLVFISFCILSLPL